MVRYPDDHDYLIRYNTGHYMEYSPVFSGQYRFEESCYTTHII